MKNSFTLLRSKFNSFIANSKTLKFVEAKLEESDLRHKKFGGSRYVVEPNVKDGRNRCLKVPISAGKLKDNKLSITKKPVISGGG